MNTKLFKKLNEQMEINKIKRTSTELTETERKEIEKKVVFENLNKNIADLVNFEQE